MSTNSLNDRGHFINGITSGAIVTAAMQPAFVIKSLTMMGYGFPPIKKLFSGLIPNIAGVAPAQGAGFWAQGLCKEHLSNWDEKSPLKAVITLFVPGIASAPFATSFERIMILQQLEPARPTLITIVARTLRQEGVKGLMRGFTPTCGREILFLGGLFSLKDALESNLTYFSNPKARNFLASVTAGMIAGFSSTPFDRMKTLMQGNPTLYPTFIKTVKSVFSQEGSKGIFKGALSRTLLVGGFICLMGRVKEIIPNYLPSSMHK